MYLDYVELENYRPYYGKQRINFGFDEIGKTHINLK